MMLKLEHFLSKVQRADETVISLKRYLQFNLICIFKILYNVLSGYIAVLCSHEFQTVPVRHIAIDIKLT